MPLTGSDTRQDSPYWEEVDVNEPKYPEVTVKLVGESGNAFAIIETVRKALKRAGHGAAADEFTAEATSGDYDNVLLTALRYVEVV